MTPTEDEHALLCLLAAGEDFTKAASMLGDRGIRASFQCILHGWIDRGQITKAGRELATKPLRTTKFQITVLPSAERKPEA